MISCILLAAGESKRFGSPKPLARFDSETVIELILNKLLKTKIDEIIVVLGAHAKEISPYIPSDLRIKTVINKDYAEGQTSSFKTGLSAIHPKAEAALLLPVDMPCVQPQTLDLLIKAFREKSPLALVPTYQEKNGHPPVFSCKLFNEFKELKNNEPLYAVQHFHDAAIIKLPVKDKGVVLSFNTPGELLSLSKLSTPFPA